MAAATCFRGFFSNLGKCRINNTTWDVTIQVLSDTLLHNLWASDSFKTVVHLTPLSMYALALSIGSCKKKSNSGVRLQVINQSAKNSVVKIGIPWFPAQTEITLSLKHSPQYWSSFNDRCSSYPTCSQTPGPSVCRPSLSPHLLTELCPPPFRLFLC